MSLYGLIIGISILIGFNYFEKHNQLIPSPKIPFFTFGLFVSALIGARAYHVIDQWTFYSANPGLIIQTWKGGLGIFGALLAGLIYLFAYTRINRIPFIALLDSITPILPLCQAVGRLGNFVNHENPVWWPEAILDLTLFFIIKTTKTKHPTGIYFIGYGIIRFFTEFWRQETWRIGMYNIGQIISILFIIFGIILFSNETAKIFKKHH